MRDFASRSLRANWIGKNVQGAEVGERFDPLTRVGIYVPAGTAPLVSTALMTLSLAEAAGVAEIVAVSPVGSDKAMNSGLLAALQLAGATEIYKVGGAQAIASLAFGTETIRPVDKIFGPGNAYVTEAKRQVFGYVAIDLIPGPSEIMVIADSSAVPRWVAADLLAQAEHGRESVICLVALDPEVIESVQLEIAQQMNSLTRGAALGEVLQQEHLFHPRQGREASNRDRKRVRARTPFISCRAQRRNGKGNTERRRHLHRQFFTGRCGRFCGGTESRAAYGRRGEIIWRIDGRSVSAPDKYRPLRSGSSP